MITKEMIDRINFLSKKSKAEGLNEEEKVEQQELRRKYIEYIKGQVRQQLDCIEFVDEDGKTSSPHKHDENCDCKKH